MEKFEQIELANGVIGMSINGEVVVNSTPHPVNINLPSGEVIVIPASPLTIRVEQHEVESTRLLGGVIPVHDIRTTGELLGLPEMQKGVSYIVSLPTAQAQLLGDNVRPDVLVIGPAIRNEKGWTVGCEGLGSLTRA